MDHTNHPTTISSMPVGGGTVAICIPVFHDDPSSLIAQLSRQRGAEQATLLVYDDGSADPDLTARITAALEGFPGHKRLITAERNLGRAAARNALILEAKADWLLFLDGDMRLDHDGFLMSYMEAATLQPGPCCIVGGFGVDGTIVTETTRLHALHSQNSECLNADARRRDPGRFVFTANIFVHRQIALNAPFNDRFRGWGWEDVDWGLGVVSAWPVVHIDNPAIHLGLDEDAVLLRKYEGSGPNFVLMLKTHPESVRRMPLFRIASRVAHLPFLGGLTWASRRAVLMRHPALPLRLRLVALKVFRVSIYAQCLNAGQP